MKRHEVRLDPADLDQINNGGRVTALTGDDTEITLSTEDAWAGPAASPGVYRVGLSSRILNDLRSRRHASCITADGDAQIVFLAEAAATQ